LSSAIAIAGLLYFAEKFPHRQFTSAELSIVSGIGHTAMSQIRNADDTPFSLGKAHCADSNAWLENPSRLQAVVSAPAKRPAFAEGRRQPAGRKERTLSPPTQAARRLSAGERLSEEGHSMIGRREAPEYPGG